MKLSRKSQRQLEIFFREYFNNENLKLPKIENYAKRGAWLVTKILGIDGITFGRHIFIKPSLLKNNTGEQLSISKVLIAHEVAHILQYQKYGVFGFFYSYLKGFFAALKQKKKWDFISRIEAYLEIPHEIEARICAAKFVEWTVEMENGKWKA